MPEKHLFAGGHGDLFGGEDLVRVEDRRGVLVQAQPGACPESDEVVSQRFFARVDHVRAHGDPGDRRDDVDRQEN